ncbi:MULTISPECIES: hypothetical protein [unclassified Acidovorax]|uniref:hypothetical protein n=1 Tax=unclassified Acidovorax TaxID=2684926 RepID=UPI0028833286|nr:MULTISPECIES: hypothetical protein [unclassified Acidovorax]
MALYELSGDHTLDPVQLSSFTDLGVYERSHLQRALRANITAITPGVRTMVLAEEFGDWVGANRRIDLLCLDEDAKLVVVELKREDGAHMELQALRYAAMISTMSFSQAVEAHRKYLSQQKSELDAELGIRAFLGKEEGTVALDETVRVVLAASNFNQELTTSVLWLNRQGLDLRCVQIRPHQLDQRVLLDVQQLIPLPEAAQYQVAVRERAQEQAAARSYDRTLARYDLSIGEKSFAGIAGRRVLHLVVAEALRLGISPKQISEAIPWRSDTVFLSSVGRLNETEFVQAMRGQSSGYFTQDAALFHIENQTYALAKRWGDQVMEAVDQVLAVLPEGTDIVYASAMTAGACATVEVGGYIIERDESTTISVSKDGVTVSPALPILRQLANQLGVSIHNRMGGTMNTRQLGAKVIQAAQSSVEGA